MESARQDHDHRVPVTGVDFDFHAVGVNAVDGGGADFGKHDEWLWLGLAEATEKLFDRSPLCRESRLRGSQSRRALVRCGAIAATGPVEGLFPTAHACAGAGNR